MSARFSLWGSLLTAKFQVTGSTHPHVLHHLRGEGPHWGLWEGDVVELFVRATAPGACSDYFEFQVSPLGQTFELRIIEPRKKVDPGFRSGFTAMAEAISPSEWHAWMQVDLGRIGWSGNLKDLEGGAFSILGKPGARSYHALFLPEQAVPDFHLPQHFQAIIR